MANLNINFLTIQLEIGASHDLQLGIHMEIVTRPEGWSVVWLCVYSMCLVGGFDCHFDRLKSSVAAESKQESLIRCFVSVATPGLVRITSEHVPRGVLHDNEGGARLVTLAVEGLSLPTVTSGSV